MRRRGVTLIELLIVLAIIGAIATLVIAAAPRFGERHRSTRGAGMLQSWLNLAKQRAIRDQRPVGVRIPPIAGVYVSELHYIEAPDEGVGGTVTVPFPVTGTTPPKYDEIAFTTSVFFDPADPAALLLPGDVVTFPDRPMALYQPRRIIGVGNAVANSGQYTYKILLEQPLPAARFTTLTHVFRRRARPIVGEPVLQFPKDIAIDVDREQPLPLGVMPSWYRMFPPMANTGGSNPFDILFSPSGQVIGYEGNLGSRICLWVRDVTLNTTGPNVLNDPNRTDPTVLPPGESTLIVVHTRTGHVTAHPIDPSGLVPNNSANKALWNPFRFTQDAKSSSE